MQRRTAIIAIAVVIALTVAAVVMIPGVLALLETTTTIPSSGSVSKLAQFQQGPSVSAGQLVLLSTPFQSESTVSQKAGQPS